MSLLSEQVNGFLEKSSWIRKMFETGAEMKKVHGAENVYDFSLGNPDLPAPKAVSEGLQEIALKAGKSYAFGYMPNSGYPELRERLAKELSKEQGVQVTSKEVIITCGAAGGLNALFRAVLEPGEEVLCPAPYFVEYGFYASNHFCTLKPVPCKPLKFELDIQAIRDFIGPKTRVVLINSPNNPTGRIYSKEELNALAEVLKEKSKEQSRPIFLVSDEPYRFLTYDEEEVSSILPLYEYSIVVSSFSKNLSLAGERVGYVLLNPEMPGAQELMDGLVFTNRIMGYVNAPAVGQQILLHALGSGVDVDVYAQRRALMQEILEKAGFEFSSPQGGFYFFPKAPNGDDLEAVKIMQEKRILGVPGSGFGFPGFFRLSFCVPEQVIENSRQAFVQAGKELRG